MGIWQKNQRDNKKKMECPFAKKRKIESDDQATSIAVIDDEIISNSNENMPESLNEQNDIDNIVEDDEAGGGEEHSGVKIQVYVLIHE